MGFELWALCYLFPFAIFAIVYSLQLYVYHYRTTIGPRASIMPDDCRDQNGFLGGYSTSTNTIHITNAPEWLVRFTRRS